MRRAAVMMVLVSACGPSVSEGPDAGPGGGAPDARPGINEFADAAAPQRCEKMDIVFVIDDSGSMAEEQSNLALNLPRFIEVIDQFVNASGVALDYRIGVTTTGRDVSYTVLGFPAPPEDGANGELLMDPGCGMSRRWFERGDPDLSGSFSCIAQVGTGGPGLEMPLYAAMLAFTERLADGTNAGFLRANALLAVVILTDEDDCSRHDDNFDLGFADGCDDSHPQVNDVSYYVEFLDSLKGGRGRWATAVIAGPGPSTCTSAFGDALYARRLEQYVAVTGDNAVFSSICDGDLTVALQDALATFDEACEQFPPIP